MAAGNVSITPGAGQSIAADAVGSNSVQIIKLWDATAGSSNALIVGADGALHANITNTVQANITGGNLTATIAANSTVNVTQIGGGNIVLGNNTAANSLPVVVATNQGSIPVTLAANQTINLDQVGGAAYALGNNTAANAMPVVIASNQASVPVTPSANSTVNVTQVGGGNLALGNATAANSVPVTVATNQGNIPVTVQSMPANITANITAIVANQTVQVTGGQAATGAALAGNPITVGGQALTAQPVQQGNATVVPFALDAGGKVINLPFASKELMVRGAATISNTTTVSVIAAQGSGNKTYITSLQLGNTGNATVTANFTDSANTTVIIPSGGGSNINFGIPLVTAANAAFSATLSANTTSVFVSAQAFVGV
jgi:hypothetical protein